MYWRLPEETPAMIILLVLGGCSVLFRPIIAFILWEAVLILGGSKQIMIGDDHCGSSRDSAPFGQLSNVSCQSLAVFELKIRKGNTTR